MISTSGSGQDNTGSAGASTPSRVAAMPQDPFLEQPQSAVHPQPRGRIAFPPGLSPATRMASASAMHLPRVYPSREDEVLGPGLTECFLSSRPLPGHRIECAAEEGGLSV